MSSDFIKSLKELSAQVKGQEFFEGKPYYTGDGEEDKFISIGTSDRDIHYEDHVLEIWDNKNNNFDLLLLGSVIAHLLTNIDVIIDALEQRIPKKDIDITLKILKERFPELG